MQEELDQPHRWLLPFTRHLDWPVWEAILPMAERRAAAVVAVSFTMQSELQTDGVSQELSRDKQLFLAALSLRARAHAVPLEWYEESAAHVLARITAMMREFQCDSLVLGEWKGQAFFLPREIARVLFISPPARLVLLQLPGPSERPDSFFWLRTLVRRAGGSFPPAALTRHAGGSQCAQLTTGEQKRSHEPCPEPEFYW